VRLLIKKEINGILHYLFEGLQEPGAGRAINYAMIAGHR